MKTLWKRGFVTKLFGFVIHSISVLRHVVFTLIFVLYSRTSIDFFRFLLLESQKWPSIYKLIYVGFHINMLLTLNISNACYILWFSLKLYYFKLLFFLDTWMWFAVIFFPFSPWKYFQCKQFHTFWRFLISCFRCYNT